MPNKGKFSEKECGRCFTKGHLGIFCAAPWAKCLKNQAVQRSKIECLRCGGQGHILRECTLSWDNIKVLRKARSAKRVRESDSSPTVCIQKIQKKAKNDPKGTKSRKCENARSIQKQPCKHTIDPQILPKSENTEILEKSSEVLVKTDKNEDIGENSATMCENRSTSNLSCHIVGECPEIRKIPESECKSSEQSSSIPKNTVQSSESSSIPESVKTLPDPGKILSKSTIPIAEKCQNFLKSQTNFFKSSILSFSSSIPSYSDTLSSGPSQVTAFRDERPVITRDITVHRVIRVPLVIDGEEYINTVERWITRYQGPVSIRYREKFPDMTPDGGFYLSGNAEGQDSFMHKLMPHMVGGLGGFVGYKSSGQAPTFDGIRPSMWYGVFNEDCIEGFEWHLEDSEKFERHWLDSADVKRGKFFVMVGLTFKSHEDEVVFTSTFNKFCKTSFVKN